MPEAGTPASAFMPHVYEIHGNVKYMHCSNEAQDCHDVFFPTPALDQLLELEEVKSMTVEVPKCASCGSNMKPHCMFFDETYSEKFHQSDTVRNFTSKADCLVVVGTTLTTGLARMIVNDFVNREAPIIEINLESYINQGLNIQVKEKAELALPTLFQEYYKLVKAEAD